MSCKSVFIRNWLRIDESMKLYAAVKNNELETERSLEAMSIHLL